MASLHRLNAHWLPSTKEADAIKLPEPLPRALPKGWYWIGALIASAAMWVGLYRLVEAVV